MRYLAIDFGARRIGLAVSDESETLVAPHATREREGTRRDVAALVDTVRSLSAEGIVVGLPRALDGAAGESEAAARDFAARLQEGLRTARLPVEIEWWDERFSTREALRQMRTLGISQKRGRQSSDAASVDARAAAVILQGFLDNRRARRQPSAERVLWESPGVGDDALGSDPLAFDDASAAEFDASFETGAAAEAPRGVERGGVLRRGGKSGATGGGRSKAQRSKKPKRG